MAKKLSQESVDLLLQNLQQAHDKQVEQFIGQIDILKEENRELKANLLYLQEREDKITKALLHAESKGEEIKSHYEKLALLEWKQLKLFAEKWKNLLLEVQEEIKIENQMRYLQYADDFAALLGKDYQNFKENNAIQVENEKKVLSPNIILHDIIEDDLNFNMNDVLYPSKDLNLEQLCKDLGLMDNEKMDEEYEEEWLKRVG